MYPLGYYTKIKHILFRFVLLLILSVYVRYHVIHCSADGNEIGYLGTAHMVSIAETNGSPVARNFRR